jgi:transposase
VLIKGSSLAILCTNLYSYCPYILRELQAAIEHLVPAPKSGGRPARYTRREILNALFYMARSGCSWLLLPHDSSTINDSVVLAVFALKARRQTVHRCHSQQTPALR